MEDAAKETKKQPRRDRVTLDPVSVTRLDRWVTQVESQIRGVRVSRSDLVNFLITHHPECLHPSEIQLLKQAHFDEAEFAEWALKEFRQAKERGEEPSLADLLKPVFPTASRASRRPKKPGAEAEEAPSKA